MLEIVVTVLSIWLLWKGVCLAFRMTWGLTKFLVGGLFALAVPLLLGCLLFAGGLLILVPLGLIGLAFGLLKACT